MAKARSKCAAAVYARKNFILAVAAQLNGPVYKGRKVLILADMGDIGEGYKARCKYSVPVAVLRRHKAVGGINESTGNVRKFLLMILPRRTEISL